jgi:hypothetical protein
MHLIDSPLCRSLRPLLCLGVALFTFMTGCNSTDSEAQARRSEAIKRIYYGQHILLSASVLGDGELFEKDLRSASDLSFLESVSLFAGTYAWETVTVEWMIDPVSGKEICLFTYPTPTAAPLCYAAIAYFGDEGHRFFTLERTADLGMGEPPAMMGEWLEPGSRINRGPRNYTDPQTFAEDVFALLREAPPIDATNSPDAVD